MTGTFIVLEGTEGSGKSTQARLLGERLRQHGYEVVLTREPGGTPIGEQIRAILFAPESCAMLPATEALLLAASRAQLVGEIIRPALIAGKMVICDRYIDSTYAYQGGGRGLAMADLRAVQQFATGGLQPDLRFFLDLPVEEGLARRLAGSDEVNRLDRAEVEFHHAVRLAYDELIAGSPDGWQRIDASGSPEDVAERIGRQVEQWLSLSRHPIPELVGGIGSQSQ